MTFQGRAWVVGDNIPTDEIVKSHMVIRPAEELAKFVLPNVHPEFAKNVRAGDILITGRHFGQSSGRAIAVKALKATGIGAVVGESFARTFYRNCFEVGLPAVECPGIGGVVQEGQSVEVDLDLALVKSITTGQTIEACSIDPFLRRMLDCGGLLQTVRSYGEAWEEVLRR